MRYYSITVKRASGNLYTGERFCNAHTPLSIGQQPSANIKIPCNEDVMPQCFCLIVEKGSGKEWQLIRKSDFYPVKVNGVDVDFICNLNDGDSISVTDADFSFKIHNDDNYAEGQGLVHAGAKKKRWQILLWCCSLVAVLAISIGYQKINENMTHFTSADNSDVKQSVYKIVVSDIILQMHTPADADGAYVDVDTYEPDSVSIGTCFFTEDSLCVTARHCVQPWVDFSGWSDNTTIMDLPQDVFWAVLAERSQMEQADTLYRVVSRCKVMDGDSCIYEFTSDECNFNMSRDIIARMGNERLPWRIIYPLYSRKNVELGDFTFVKTSRRGALSLATDEYLSSISNEEKAERRIYGYPKTNNGNLWEYQDIANISIPERDEDGYFSRCIQLTVNGTSGYSGAPVIEKKNGTMMVVGIFSKMDDFVDNKNTFYAVPATEVSQYNHVKANETKQYRR